MIFLAIIAGAVAALFAAYALNKTDAQKWIDGTKAKYLK